MSPDSHTYSRWADLLITHNFNIPAYLGDNDFVTPPIFYLLPVLLISLCKALMSDWWPSAYMGLNLLWLSGMGFLFVRLARHLEIRPIIITLTLILMLLSADLHYWPSYLLTDTLSAFLVMANLYLALLNGSKSGAVGPMRYLLQGFLLLLLLLTRPSSPPMIVAFVAITLLSYLPYRLLQSKILLPTLAAAITLIALGYGALFSMQINGSIDGGDQMAFIARYIATGEVIHDRPETRIKIAHTTAGVAGFYLLRLAGFFNPIAASYSLGHNVANVAILGTIGLAVLVWMALTLSTRTAQNIDRYLNTRSIALLLFSLSVALFHAAILVDYDWRYRFPVILPLLLFSGAVAELLWRLMRMEER